ncbi:MAG TPA: hypothetical protein PLU39_07055 [Armatimonadota bacterium]|nr:hypothetical protein [Armatimonadota bacterium]HOJ21672.1 hypothetical protein [Armatimonadota bacterium]HOM82265.1 hypothetical protein [Armatimonadota bacterium]HPO72602.1 hypothetical protein [Armatimonadota bacterium]HPT97612.1 hypothetical protein [Armatimonadota bacterium]
MKPNRISAQWVGALILSLAGLLLAGCGGSDDGAKSGADLTEYTFSVVGTAYLEREPATRGLASGDIRLGGATYRVLRRSDSGTSVHQTGTTAPDGSYSLAVDVPVGASPDDLWQLEIFAPGVRIPDANGSTVVANVLLLSTLVPGPGALLSRDANIASTLVAGHLEALYDAGGPVMQITRAQINTLEQRVAELARTPAPGSTPVRLSAVSTHLSTPEAAHASVVSGLAEPVVNVLNSLVSRIRVLNTGVEATSVSIPVGTGTTLIAEPLDSAGNPIPAGVEFLVDTGANSIRVAPSAYNTVILEGVAAGNAGLVARLTIPGTIDIAPKSTRVDVTVLGPGQ